MVFIWFFLSIISFPPLVVITKQVNNEFEERDQAPDAVVALAAAVLACLWPLTWPILGLIWIGKEIMKFDDEIRGKNR